MADVNHGTATSYASDRIAGLKERLDASDRRAMLTRKRLVELDESTANVCAAIDGRVDGLERELDALYDALWDERDRIDELEFTNGVLVLAILAFAVLLPLSWAT